MRVENSLHSRWRVQRSRDHIYATLVERWNGKRWSVQPFDNPLSRFSTLSNGSCGSTVTCIAVGYYHGGRMAFPLVERSSDRRESGSTTANADAELLDLSDMPILRRDSRADTPPEVETQRLASAFRCRLQPDDPLASPGFSIVCAPFAIELGSTPAGAPGGTRM